MKEYLLINDLGEISPGNFIEYQVTSSNGSEFHNFEEFLVAFSLRVMNTYESQPLSEIFEIDAGDLEIPERTKFFYRRLLDDGQYSYDFINICTEVLCQWIEENLDNVQFAYNGLPHNSDPAYDTLTIVKEGDHYKLRVVQVKATKNNLQNNCNLALEKFEKLERGHFDAELSASLDIMVNHRNVPEGLKVRELKIDRRYRLMAVFEEDRSEIQIMTTFDSKITGNSIRRSGMLVRIDWDSLWKRLAEIIYAQLT